MNRALNFELDVNFDLEQHRDRLAADAYVTVRAFAAAQDEAGARRSGAGLAEVVLLDHSGSMTYPISKLHMAKRAAKAAIDLLGDGTLFAIVGGTHDAHMTYPREKELAVADARTRAAARKAVDAIAPGTQGTRIGAWLDLAGELLAPHPDRVRHATLLTDGKNQHQDSAERTMEQVLADCRGVFSCDARGIGADWEPAELRLIAAQLQGTADAVPDIADLEEAFRAIVQDAAGWTVPQVALRVRHPDGIEVAAFEQTVPALADLVPHRTPVPGTIAVDYPTGPWGEEERSYVLTLVLKRRPAAAGTVDRLASVEVVTGAVGTATAATPTLTVPVDVLWLDIPSPGTRLDPALRRHREEKELRELRQSGGVLYKRRDLAGAQDAWGRAVALATSLRNEDALGRLRRVVRIDDAAAGQVSILPNLDIEYVLQVTLGDNTSSRARAEPVRFADPPQAAAASVPAPAGPDLVCPKCGWVVPAGSRYCEKWDCDHEFTREAEG